MSLESLSFEARQRTKKTQKDNQRQLQSKTEAVSAGKEELRTVDKETKEKVGSYRQAKERLAQLERNFDEVVGQSSVRNLLAEKLTQAVAEQATPETETEKKKEVELTLANCALYNVPGLEELTEQYKAVTDTMAQSREEFEGKIGERAMVKNKLRGVLKGENPAFNLRTGKSLIKEAYGQEMGIPEKAIAELVETRLVGREDEIVKILSKAERSYGYDQLFTEADVEALQKYDTFSEFNQAEEQLLKRMGEVVVRAYDRWVTTLPAEKQAEYSDRSESQKQGFVRVLRDQWQQMKGYVLRKQEDLDQKMYQNERVDRIEKMKPEVEVAFAEFQTELIANPYNRLVNSFSKVQDDFTVDLRPTTKSSFENEVRARFLASPVSFDMNTDSLKQVLERLQTIQAETVAAEGVLMGEKTAFDGRNPFYRWTNGEEGKRISQKLGKIGDEKFIQGKFSDLLETIIKFFEKVEGLEKASHVNVRLRRHEATYDVSDIMTFKQDYVEALEQQKNTR